MENNNQLYELNGSPIDKFMKHLKSNMSEEEIKDSRAMYGLDQGWYYKNILVKYYYNKDFKYEIDIVDGNVRIYEDKKYNLFIEFRKLYDNYKIYVSQIDGYDMLSGYRYDCSVSEKLGNSFIRYFAGNPKKLDAIRIKDYVKRKAFYGNLFDYTIGRYIVKS